MELKIETNNISTNKIDYSIFTEHSDTRNLIARKAIDLEDKFIIKSLEHLGYVNIKHRTCENCKWYQDKCCTNRSFYTSNRTSVYIQVDEDFGCNRFENKD